jgi:hypothetical protein
MTMTNHEWRDVPYDVIQSRAEYSTLLDDNGDMLPIVDAFCQGYAEAILFANAYRYVYLPEDVNYDDGELENDTDAQYAYQSPGKWWEGMGIDFTDAIDFLAANFDTLEYLTELPRADTWRQHGHDFAFTRNHHGVGFWDRGYGHMGDALTNAARAYGEHSVLTNDGPAVETL